MVSATKPAATSVLPSLCKAGSAAQPAFRGELWATRIACMDFLVVFFADSIEKSGAAQHQH